MLFSLNNLRKKYGDLEAISGLDVEVDRGAIGLLGPNGAGKTTLLKLLLGMLEPTTGSATVLGHRVPGETKAIRRITGFMPEDQCYLPYSTAVEFVTVGARLSGLPKDEAFRRAHQVLHYVGLGEERYRDVGEFSEGMKQRVKLAQALVHGPELVMLDEPTSGLDPQGRDEILELIEDVVDRGISVILSSHVLSEVEAVCEDVLMLNDGELMHYGSVRGLTIEDERRVVEVRTRDANPQFADMLRDRGWTVDEEGAKVEVAVEEAGREREILELAVEEGIQLRHFMPKRATLESAFLEKLG